MTFYYEKNCRICDLIITDATDNQKDKKLKEARGELEVAKAALPSRTPTGHARFLISEYSS